MNPQTIWNKELVQVLMDAWLGGKSAKQIANDFGMTRNMIMGKVSRLRASKLLDDTNRDGIMPAHMRPKKGSINQRKKARALANKAGAVTFAPARVLPTPPAPHPRVKGGVSIMDLEAGSCKAVIGSGPDGLARYCGAQTEERQISATSVSTSYCGPHHSLYHQPMYGRR